MNKFISSYKCIRHACIYMYTYTYDCGVELKSLVAKPLVTFRERCRERINVIPGNRV